MGLNDFLSQTFFIVLFISLLYRGRVSAEVYTVGGDEGWTTSNNYLEWSQGLNFTVGDVLGQERSKNRTSNYISASRNLQFLTPGLHFVAVFNYVRGQHDAVEVTEDTFRSCDDSSGVIKRYVTGDDEVTLEEARKYWFICSISGHCLGGMKLAVDVKGVQTETNTNGPATDQAGNGTGSSQRWSFRSMGLICATLLILLLSIC
ncbi:chemocyanin-like [Aristolochia californica]|uniref:chemocyanin-like n=1 Tax=Aristolochia californica TaxID=171875 RepID=UPI0035DC6971